MAKEKVVKGNSFDDVLSQMNSDFGDGSVMKFSQRQEKEYQYISTDSYAFDKAIGGGFVLGKMYEMAGWEGAGKSTICGHLCKNAQRDYPDKKVVYIDAENSLDLEYFANIGVDVDNLYIVQVRSAEEGYTITEKLINTGEVSLCVIDSDTAMQPQALIEGDFGELKMGLKARINGQVYPRLHKAIAINNTCLVSILQFREKIGIVYGSPTTTSGGHAIKFTADCRLEVSKSLAKEGEDVYGSTITIKAIKNRLAAPFKKASFEVVFGKGINKIKDTLAFAIDEGIINKAGAGWMSYGEYKIQGLDKFEAIINDNPEVLEEIEQKIKDKIYGDKNK